MKILYLSPISFQWAKQRPQFLSEGLSKLGHEVDYVVAVPYGKPKGNSFLYEKLRVREFFVVPLALRFKAVRYINKEILKKINWKSYDVIIVAYPTYVEYIPEDINNIIYDCMDNIPSFHSGNKKDALRKMEMKLCLRASKIVTSSEYLKSKIINDYQIREQNITVIRNAAADDYATLPTTKLNLEYPNLVYVGTVDEWFDKNAVLNFARKNTNWTIYIVGPVRKNWDNVPKNIKFVGKVTHEEAKAYVYYGQIMIIPFVVNDLIEGVDPVKLYEYATFNKPIVSSYWKELDYFKGENISYYKGTKFECIVKEVFKKAHTAKADHNDLQSYDWKMRCRAYNYILKYCSSKGIKQMDLY